MIRQLKLHVWRDAVKVKASGHSRTMYLQFRIDFQHVLRVKLEMSCATVPQFAAFWGSCITKCQTLKLISWLEVLDLCWMNEIYFSESVYPKSSLLG